MSVSGTNQKGIVFASSNVYTQLTGTVSASTAFVELTASTSAAILITHVSRTPASNNTGNNTSVSIATGAAASEVIIFTGYSVGSNSGQQPGPTVYALPFPIRVSAGTRLSFKLAASGLDSTTVGVIYVSESAVA